MKRTGNFHCHGKRFVAACGIAAFLISAALLEAHPESISSVELRIEKEGARVSLTLQTRDLSGWFPPGDHSDYKAYVLAGLKEQAPELFEFQADHQAVAPTDVTLHCDKPGCVRVDLFFKFPASTQLLMIRSKNLVKLPAGHQQLLCAEDCRASFRPGDETPVVLEQPLTSDQDFAEIQMPDPPVSAPATQPTR